MSDQGIFQILFYVVVLIALGYPLGLLHGPRLLRPLPRAAAALPAPERGFYRLVDTEPAEQDWKGYAKTALIFSASSRCSSTCCCACRATSSSTRTA